MLNEILLGAIILIAIAMVAVILLQRSEGGALGMSGGGPGNFMSARGTGDLLSRTTMILAGLFFVLCLLMTLVGGHHAKSSIVNPNDVGRINPASLPTQTAPAQTAPAQTAPGQTAPGQLPPGVLPSQAPAQPAPTNPQDLFGQGPASTPKH
jgi:preprotein translocase subunit SecG